MSQKGIASKQAVVTLLSALKIRHLIGKMYFMPQIGSELDQYDRKILDAVTRDGRISITALANKIGLSKTPTQLRLKRLQKEGYIEGYRAVVSAAKLGLEHVAFVEVKLSDTREDALRKFNAATKAIPEVEECHMIAGDFDYLLKVRTSDIKRYRQVLGEKISSLPHVANTHRRHRGFPGRGNAATGFRSRLPLSALRSRHPGRAPHPRQA